LAQQYNQTVESYITAGVCRNVGEDATPEQQKACEEDKAQRQQKIDKYVGELRQIAIESYERKSPGYLQLVNKYGGMFGQVLDLIEYDTVTFQKKMDCESGEQRENEDRPHPFNSSNLTKTIVDLTLPGIGGLQLFQAFGVRRVPSIVERGYYVITKVAHEFSAESGWITKVQGRFRFNPNLNENVSRPPCPPLPGQCVGTPTCQEPALTTGTEPNTPPPTTPRTPRSPATPTQPARQGGGAASPTQPPSLTTEQLARLTPVEQQELDNLRTIKTQLIQQYGRAHYNVYYAQQFDPRITALEAKARG
jgi:hypothetical protein